MLVRHLDESVFLLQRLRGQESQFRFAFVRSCAKKTGRSIGVTKVSEYYREVEVYHFQLQHM